MISKTNLSKINPTYNVVRNLQSCLSSTCLHRKYNVHSRQQNLGRYSFSTSIHSVFQHSSIYRATVNTYNIDGGELNNSVKSGKVDFNKLDHKWRAKWGGNSVRATYAKNGGPATTGSNDCTKHENGNYYVLSMFPYPSGNLHMGHVRVYTISDSIARYHHLNGKNVLHPMGWDAFGLPAENAAIDNNTNPYTWTKSNIETMKNQLKIINIDIDWDKEFATCDPEYYKWTQYIFLQLYHRGLVYKKEATVNWDPVDKTVLANEQVDKNGLSWRSGAVVEKKKLKQWFIRITEYADALLNDLDKLKKWPEHVKMMQRQWIGKSKGAEFDFKVTGLEDSSNINLTVFTSRPDTVFGVRYLAISCEHRLINSKYLPNERAQQVLDFAEKLKQKGTNKTDADLTSGIFTGLYAIHPINRDEIVPIYVSGYVLPDYGSGAVMGVPAHDSTDFNFAHANEMSDFKVVVMPEPGSTTESGFADKSVTLPYCERGVLVKNVENGGYGGMASDEAANSIVRAAKSLNTGRPKTQYRLRDWLVSRQRYWGAPVPFIKCGNCGDVPVPEEDLPVLLPLDVEVQARGGNILENMESWVNTQCPKCKGKAKRETETMDTFVDSSWYYFRFLDSKNDNVPFDPETANKNIPVDIYIGGVEHAILHLMYSRFVTKALSSTGKFEFVDKTHNTQKSLNPVNGNLVEPFASLLTQGMVHGKTFKDPDNGRFLKPDEVDLSNSKLPTIKATGKSPAVSFEKMSKSKFNGIDPRNVVSEYGADVVRLYMLYKAHPSDVLEYDTSGIVGMQRWLNKLFKIASSIQPSFALVSPSELQDRISWAPENKKTYFLAQKAIKKSTETFEDTYSFNTFIALLIELSNHISLLPQNLLLHKSTFYAFEKLVIMLSPLAPVSSEELYEIITVNSLSSDSSGASDLDPLSSCGGLKAGSVFANQWPVLDESGLALDSFTCVVQVNGKVKFKLDADSSLLQNNDDLKAHVLSCPDSKKHLFNAADGVPKAFKKVIFVNGGKLINFILA